MEISVDLINQLKLSLRKNTKLSSFGDDYSDSSFPTLPTSTEAIAELDASPLYLRCRNCKGKLLRGIESLICVFCGNQQRTSDNPPDPIKFTSSSAYKLFLTSLNLDGSELVEPLKETNGSNRGAKVPVVKGVPISKFLDLEIQWAAIEDKSMNGGLGDGQSVQSKKPLNLGGINLDDFFVEGKGDLSKVEPAESKAVEDDDDFSDPRSLSLFDSAKTPGVVGSQQHVNVGLFKGKDTQNVGSAGKHENLSLFSGQDAKESVSLPEQGNFAFFEGKDAQYSSKEGDTQRTSSSKKDESFGFFEGKISSSKEDENLALFEGKDAQRITSSKDNKSFGLFEGKDAQRTNSSKDNESFGLFQGKDAQRTSSAKDDETFGLFNGEDAQRTSSSKDDESFGLFEDKDAQRTSSSKDDESFGLFKGKDAQRTSSSKDDESFGLFEGAQSSNAGLKSLDDKNVASSSDWNSDFQSADHDIFQEKIGGDPFVSSQVDMAAHMDSFFGSANDSLYAKPADSSTSWLQDDLFGNITGETQNNNSAVHGKTEGQVMEGNGSSSMDIDWIGDDLWQTSEKKSIEKTASDVNDDDDDDWNDFASSANSKPPNNPLSQTMERSQDEKQNTVASVMSDIGKGQEDDLFGTWDSFTSSTISQTPLQPPTNHVNPPSETNPEMDLFGAQNNHRDLDFGSISNSDLFSESIGGKTNSEEVKATPSATSTLNRDPDVGSTAIAPKSKSDIAEELMSQMRDLSFMLETELSVPPISKTE